MLRFPKDVLRKRLERFQELLKSKGIDAAMIRVLSTYTYFTGTRWLRPALLIPADGDPILFAARGEEDELLSRTWIKNVMTFRDGGELMRTVSGIVRSNGYRRVGIEFGIERDAYILFYEMFKRLNPNVDVIDISDLVYELRMIKDGYELESIRRAGELAVKVMDKVLNIIKPGITETKLAAEAYYQALRLGSEDPKVYVNVGPSPRVHAESFRDIKVSGREAVTLILGIDYNNYYANMSRTVLLGSSDVGGTALKCMREVYEEARRLTKPGVKPIDVMKRLDKIYSEYGLIEYRVIGYLHGVGLQVEEPPITTIVPKHRFIGLSPNMTIAFIHSPIMIKGVGQIKFEDTYIVTEEGLELVTKYELW